MSNIRHSTSLAPAVRAVSVGFSSGYHWTLRGSDWGELVWASRGVITVTVGSLVWVVPSHQALWLPPRTTHAVRMAGSGTLRQVYVTPAHGGPLPAAPAVMQVSPLLRELLRRVCAMGTLDVQLGEQRRLFEVMLDELVAVGGGPLELPMPRDARALRAATLTRAEPARSVSARHIARDAHASLRTLERLFRAETGLSFGAWRQRARLVHAMTLLADGATVTAAGAAVGYANTSAFVTAFRRLLGMTPGRYAESTTMRRESSRGRL